VADDTADGGVVMGALDPSYPGAAVEAVAVDVGGAGLQVDLLARGGRRRGRGDSHRVHGPVHDALRPDQPPHDGGRRVPTLHHALNGDLHILFDWHELIARIQPTPVQ